MLLKNPLPRIFIPIAAEFIFAISLELNASKLVNFQIIIVIRCKSVCKRQAAYLTQWTSPETLMAGAMSSAMFESWCVSEILKSYAFRFFSSMPAFG